MKHTKTTELCLVPLDTEGDWNRPLLKNAASMSGATCIFAASEASSPGQTEGMYSDRRALVDFLGDFQHVIACEAVRDSRNIYEFPAPRGNAAIIVGNESKGIPRSVLKKADSIVAIPMTGAGMSSVNVAVSAAIALYVLTKDIGRKKRARSDLTHRDIDVLINAPADPHELGSLLRSAWAFGWRRVFVSDPHGIWFTQDQQMVLDSRAAARRAKNPLTVLPANQVDMDAYERILLCDGQHEGTPLSRLRLPPCRTMLIVCGDTTIVEEAGAIDRIYVDHANSGFLPRFRHAGSILLSMVSQMITSYENRCY